MKIEVKESVKEIIVKFDYGIISHKSDRELYTVGFFDHFSFEPETTYTDFKHLSRKHLISLRDAINVIIDKTDDKRR